MSFNTGGHTIYAASPVKTSPPHVSTVTNGSQVVFTEVPSGADEDGTAEETIGTFFPEQSVAGRIVG